MRLSRIAILLLCVGIAACAKEQEDATAAFMDAARSLFTDQDTVGGLRGVVNEFMRSETGKMVGDMLTSGKSGGGNGAGQLMSGLGSLLSGAAGSEGGLNVPLISSLLENLVQGADPTGKTKRSTEDETGGFDFASMMNLASTFLGQNGKADGLMGMLPLLMDSFDTGAAENNDDTRTGHPKHDHSGHSWFLPPILENLHIVWEHFRDSELGQTLWKNSGLAKIVGTMTDAEGRIQFEKVFNSFENPSIRRRWIKSLTNFVSEWVSHISDPMIRQRYMVTAQYVGNGFLKAQGYPKTVTFDPAQPAESLSRIANAISQRHLNMKIDSSQYIRPAVAYFQDIVNLASQKGFIMSYINAKELSNKLSDTINNEFVEPLLKVYRAYKWAVKSPDCAAHILCIINEKEAGEPVTLRSQLTKLASFPAAWAISTKTTLTFWTLYGAIIESERCFAKHPADCNAFHEEEVRVTTEVVHSEL